VLDEWLGAGGQLAAASHPPLGHGGCGATPPRPRAGPASRSCWTPRVCGWGRLAGRVALFGDVACWAYASAGARYGHLVGVRRARGGRGGKGISGNGTSASRPARVVGEG